MLIGMTEATTKMPARATITAAPPTTSGTPAATTEPNTTMQRQRRQRQRDELAPPEVGLGHGLDVAVEGRAAGQLDRRARARRGAARAGSAAHRANRRAAGRGRRCRRRCGGRPRPGAATGGATRPGRRAARSGRRGSRRRAAASKAGVPASSVGLLKTMTSADGGDAELGLEERLGPGRFEVVEDEAAGAQLARDLRRERDAPRAAARPRRRPPTTRGARRIARVDRRGSRQSPNRYGARTSFAAFRPIC